MVTEDEYGGLTGQAPNGTAEKIRQWLVNNYLSYSIEYVLLIGNPSPTGNVPMKMCWPRRGEASYQESPTDYFYADLTGNWDLDGDGYFGEYPDDGGPGGVDFANEVYVGRIPVYSGVTELDSVLNKTINYANESNIAWRSNALLPMSFSDSTTDGAYLSEAMKSDYLSSSGFSSWTLYQQGSLCPVADSIFVSNEELVDGATQARWMTNPYGMVWWWGHGNSTGASLGYSGCGWGTIMSSSGTSSLNDFYPSFVYQCSCLNGYPEVTNNLGTELLYNGAIGTVSATRVSWYAVTSWSVGLKYYCDNASIGYYFGKELASSGKKVAVALYDVKSDMGANHHTWWGGSHWMNLFDFNLYGDPVRSLGDQALTHTVSTPSVPTGPSQGTVNTGYTFSTGDSVCNQGHAVEYRFDWGDGSYSDWSSSTSVSHTWTTVDTFTLRAQARCSQNHAVESSWSSGKALVILTCVLPSAPIDPSPSNGVTVASIHTGLSWKGDASADSYDVYFGTSVSPPFYANTTESFYALPTLDPGTTYQWKVVAKNSCGEVEGPVWHFATEDGTPGDTNYGVYRPSNSCFYLDTDWDSYANTVKVYGAVGDYPVTGDWDGDGDTDYGIFRPGQCKFFLDTDGDGFADLVKAYGSPGDVPITGDWNGDGRTNYGVFRPSTCLFYLDTDWDSFANITKAYGGLGDIPVTGDWNGDGITDYGVYRPSNCKFFLDTDRDSFANIVRAYGGLGDIPIIGDWDGDGQCNYGVYRTSNCKFYLDTSGDSYADIVRAYGSPGDVPISGNWDGQ